MQFDRRKSKLVCGKSSIIFRLRKFAKEFLIERRDSSDFDWYRNIKILMKFAFSLRIVAS